MYAKRDPLRRPLTDEFDERTAFGRPRWHRPILRAKCASVAAHSKVPIQAIFRQHISVEAQFAFVIDAKRCYRSTRAYVLYDDPARQYVDYGVYSCRITQTSLPERAQLVAYESDRDRVRRQGPRRKAVRP
jgi:hypothetical protein